MAGNLPVNLLDETGQMLQRVVHAHLPAERWGDIAAALSRVDNAVQAGEETALQREIVQLRWVVQELAPGYGVPAQPTYGAPPVPDAPSGYGAPAPPAFGAPTAPDAPPTYGAPAQPAFSAPVPSPYGAPPTAPLRGGRKSALWVFLALFAGLCAAPVAVVFLTKGEAAPLAPEAPGDNGTTSYWFAGALAVLAVAVVAIAVVINVRRRSRRTTWVPVPPVTPRPLVTPPRLMPAPAQVREQANRTIMSLAAHGGRP